jgi:cytochrome c oxidase subunit 2
VITRFVFTPKATGTYEIVCAEMCGLQHYKMRGEMTIHSDEDYADWHREATVLAAAAYDPEDEEARWGWEWEEAK